MPKHCIALYNTLRQEFTILEKLPFYCSSQYLGQHLGPDHVAFWHKFSSVAASTELIQHFLFLCTGTRPESAKWFCRRGKWGFGTFTYKWTFITFKPFPKDFSNLVSVATYPSWGNSSATFYTSDWYTKAGTGVATITTELSTVWHSMKNCWHK